MIDTDSLRKFAGRNWKVAEQDTASSSAARRLGDDDLLRRAHLLWLHIKAVRPDWPDAASRAEDLDHHIQFQALIVRANRAPFGI
ncbi:MAG: hypothetical protein A3H91_10185 [Gammaproteobacteria bacterium RIFCSPLOWO2_02_FULL_61_13]|nr:MAG: hypothetical protein A3H91_10185 [Gammaproteobacteria bacterium RIFCSPLOWO2_02_FULL_61_13]